MKYLWLQMTGFFACLSGRKTFSLFSRLPRYLVEPDTFFFEAAGNIIMTKHWRWLSFSNNLWIKKLSGNLWRIFSGWLRFEYLVRNNSYCFLVLLSLCWQNLDESTPHFKGLKGYHSGGWMGITLGFWVWFQMDPDTGYLFWSNLDVLETGPLLSHYSRILAPPEPTISHIYIWHSTHTGCASCYFWQGSLVFTYKAKHSQIPQILTWRECKIFYMVCSFYTHWEVRGFYQKKLDRLVQVDIKCNTIKFYHFLFGDNWSVFHFLGYTMYTGNSAAREKVPTYPK